MPSSSSNLSNDYGDDLARWKTDLILRLAAKRGYRPDELPEVQQDLAPVVAAFVFDPAKSNGATERTVLTGVIDRQLLKLLRKRARHQNAMAELTRQAVVEDQRRPELDEAADITASDRCSDVASCLARLDSSDREICEALAAGEPLDQIAKNQDLSWRGLETAIARIRQAFRAMGLDAWMRSA